MSLLRKISDIVSHTSITEPVFIKADSDAERQLEQLKSLYELSVGDTRLQIETDIRYLNQGILGEKQIAYELKNSHIPMLILHDLNIFLDGLSAQIDYVIILRTSVIIIECKNLYGNIEVNSSGDFIRTIEFNGRYRKEGIYSPITQNIRHLELIKKARIASGRDVLDRLMLSKGVERYYRSIVVLANPKTVINMKYAQKSVKDQIIKADQLINYLKKVLNATQGEEMSSTAMIELSQFFTSLHRNTPNDYTAKYKIDLKPSFEPIMKPASKPAPEPIPQQGAAIEETAIYKALKEYRLMKCREKDIKAYYIFNNAQLEELCKFAPKSPEDMLRISGFDQKRISEYGVDIIQIIRRF